MPVIKSQEFLIQWHLTERCNLRCKHCYQNSGSRRELPLGEILESIEEIAEMLSAWEETYGIHMSPSFSITGGEPFLRSDLFSVLRALVERDFSPTILSNGTLIDKESAEELARIGVKGVQVSLEGPRYINDRIRGKWSFESATRGVQNLLEAGIPVTLNVTLSNLNASYFPDMVGVASSLGAQRLGFSRLVPLGRGRKMVTSGLRKETVRDLYQAIDATESEGVEIVSGDPLVSQMHFSPQGGQNDIPFGGCAAGVSGMTILSDGTVTPCRRLGIPIGRLSDDSLREIWADSEVLRSLRTREAYKGKCATCARWADCRGCRAVAYAYSGDFLSEDPHCFIDEDVEIESPVRSA